MPFLIRFGYALLGLTLLTNSAFAVTTETQLFNGKNLDGWTFHAEESSSDEQKPEVSDPWVVARGALVSRGVASGYLIHKDALENYVLTLEVRTMSTEEGNGAAVGSLGSLFVNAAPEKGAFNYPKSIEISLREDGDVYFRDLKDDQRSDTDFWVHRAPDRRDMGHHDDVQRDMGEWNQVKVISNGKRLTVMINGIPVNQVEPINRTTGALAIRCDRGFIAAPTFYRNLTVKPIGPADLQAEQQATAVLSKAKAVIAQKRATEQAAMAAQEERKAATEKKMSKEWADVDVTENEDFVADVRRLPFPKDTREIEFSAAFGDVEFESPSSLAAMSAFYRTEMASRGWKITDTDIEEDEVTITYEQGDAEVELNIDGDSSGVDVTLDCEELSFEGTDNPAELARLGVPQPQGYLVLQREFTLPEGVRDHEFNSGDSRIFKSTMKLPQLYEFLTQQLRQKGYRESRRPIINEGRRYSEFVKGNVELSVNTFTHALGSRAVLEYEKD